jgi:hypothetical protein
MSLKRIADFTWSVHSGQGAATLRSSEKELSEARILYNVFRLGDVADFYLFGYLTLYSW